MTLFYNNGIFGIIIIENLISCNEELILAILKKKTFWLMLFLIILGTVLRLIFINKPDGLWNDEYLSWMIASIPIGKKFIQEVMAQCHMPFYYLYLKFFIHFLGNSDLMLRLTSVLPGVLAIPTMYSVGKEFKDERLGILCASFVTLSSFLIYFSQEVRFYGLLFLFSSLSLLFTLKLFHKQNLSNFIFYLISNFMIIITHTIGVIFVLFNFAFTSYWLLKNNNKCKKIIINSWIVIGIIALICLPLLYNISTSHPLSQWWSHFTVSKLAFLFTDYFSPILTNLVSAPDNFFYHFSILFIIFAILPSAIAIAGIIKAVRSQNNEILVLLYVSFAFIFVLFLMAISNKLLFITKYSIEVYPTLILTAAYGLLKFEKNLKTILIFLFCFLNLFYIIASTKSAPKLHRSEGHKIVAEILKNAGLNKDDLIVLNYYPKNRFEKYFNFDKYRVIAITKGSFPEYLGVNSVNGFSKIDNKYFENKFKSEIFNKLRPNQKVAIVVLNDVAIYSPTQMQLLLNNGNYTKIPLLFLAFSQLKNDFISEGLQKLQIQRIEEKGSWAVITFKK